MGEALSKTADGWIIADISDSGWFGTENLPPKHAEQLSKLKGDLRVRVTNRKGLQHVPSYFLKGLPVLEIDLSGLSNVTEVGNDFLCGCDSLRQVDLSPLSNVSEVGDSFMCGCRWLQQVDLSPLLKVTELRDSFLGDCTSLRQVDLSPLSNVTDVGNDFLHGCKSLQQVDLSGLSNVTEVGNHFLGGCESLRRVCLSGLSSVTEVGDSFLRGCRSLQQVDLSPLSKVTDVGNDFLHGCEWLQHVDLSGLSNVTEVGDSFLHDCMSLQQVDLSGLSSVNKVGDYFLYYCKSLQQVDLSLLSNVTKVGDSFLYCCESLQQVDLSPLSKVTEVGDYFLCGCTSLQQVDLSGLSNVYEVGDYFLHGCESLQQVDLSLLSKVTGKVLCSQVPSTVRVSNFAEEVAAKTQQQDRTLESSVFLSEHKKSSRPKKLYELLAAVDALIHVFAEAKGIPAAEADTFFHSLQANGLSSAERAEFQESEQLMYIALRLWTSAEDLGRCELCGIVNEAIRSDARPAIDHAIKFVHAINAFCVTRRSGKKLAVPWPADNRVYRGGAMPRIHQEFFKAGRMYRAPMFVATSLVEDTAVKFMRRLDGAAVEQRPPYQEPVMWIFHFDATLPEHLRCVHVNYIDKTDETVNQEDEMLFAPYSVFTVRSAKWEANAEVNDYTIHPHVIEVNVASDNAKAPRGLPLAPWC